MKLSYIVSAYHRPDHLACCLYSLKVQTERCFEVIVCDNAIDGPMMQANFNRVEEMRDSRFHYKSTGPLAIGDCYWTAEWAALKASGEFLCFPSDDSYYVPTFGARMLEEAHNRGLDLVYSEMVYDNRMYGHYAVVNVQPVVGKIDKTGFIIRHSAFKGFPNKVQPGEQRECKVDGEMIQSLVRQGIRHGKIPDILVVHN